MSLVWTEIGAMMLKTLFVVWTLYSIVAFATGIYVLSEVDPKEPNQSDLFTASVIGLTWPLFWTWRLAYK